MDKIIMANSNNNDPICPYPLDEEDLDYLKKAVKSMSKERYGKKDFLGENLCYTNSVTFSRTHTATSNEHNYHAERNIEERSCYDKEKIFSDILKRGIDEEDMFYLEKSFFALKWDDEKDWAQRVRWIPHPTTSDRLQYQEEFVEFGCLPLNKSGCARSEGFVKRSKKCSKMQANYQCQEAESMMNGRVLPYSKVYKGNKKTLSRDARNDQRRLSTAYQTITQSNLLSLNELKFRKKKLKLGKSDIHGLGLFASEPIGPNEIIIEYVGQIIRPIIADLRENDYNRYGLGYYSFLIDESTVIDATRYGNINRYINHSCNPNSYARILVINNKKKIVIYSKRQINENEEITYDYKMKIEDDKIKCLCKAPTCRKSIN